MLSRLRLNLHRLIGPLGPLPGATGIWMFHSTITWSALRWSLTLETLFPASREEKNIFFKKKENSDKQSYLTLHLKGLEKEEQAKLKLMEGNNKDWS